jgi:hypothetical protein
MTSLGYEQRKVSGALEAYRKLRADNHELLKELPEAAFTRIATHSKDGVMTLRASVEWFTQHAETHVGDIQAIRAAYKEHRAKELAAQTNS